MCTKGWIDFLKTTTATSTPRRTGSYMSYMGHMAACESTMMSAMMTAVVTMMAMVMVTY